VNKDLGLRTVLKNLDRSTQNTAFSTIVAYTNRTVQDALLNMD
jgi:hypothetical protein